MKTAISIPDALFQAAERLAARLRISRSELYQRAVALFVGEHGHDGVTEALDRVYGEESDAGRLDPFLAELQAASLPKEDW